MKQWRLVTAGTVLATSVGGLAVAAQRPAKPAKAAAAKVAAVDGAGLKKAIDGCRGKVVVVNLWATWCAPCVEEFPDLVRLYNARRKDGLVVVAVSVDEPEDRQKVAQFIAGQKAGFPVYIRARGPVDPFIDPFDPNWRGAVPVTYVIDRQGKISGKPMIGLQTYESFAAAVEPLLR